MKFEKVKFDSTTALQIEERAWHSATLINDKIYYYGGLKLNNEFSKSLLIHNLLNDTLSSIKLKGKNIERCCHSAVQVDTTILILGGYNF